ncbi:MAG: ATP-binding protein [Bacteroidales bacterium]|jgi:predicted AAA+ superfamily ATPase|nr:ATP-binding protein [Bacteroidales bacterium]
MNDSKNIIFRKEYTERIKPFIDKPVIKVLTGQRRVGKSYILLQLMQEIKLQNPTAHIIFIDKELDEFSHIQDHKELYAHIGTLLKEANNYLFIDEVQEISSFELCLRSLLNEGKCDIFCAGSNANLLSGELATHLAGRYVAFEIHSLSYVEFLEFHRLENTNHSLNRYLTMGGMPFLTHFSADKDSAFEYLKNVYSAILLRDVVARESIRNVSFLENLVSYLSDNVGNILSAYNISKYLKSQQINLTPQTVLNYLHSLCNAFFVYRIPRADVVGLKIFEVGEKYYFEDIGIRNSLRTFNFRKDINKLMENVVCLHLMRQKYRVFVGKIDDKEIDFVAEKDGERLYIQVAYMLSEDATIEREFGNLMNIPDQYPKMVITMDEISIGNYKGIKQMHLREFLSMASI